MKLFRDLTDQEDEFAVFMQKVHNDDENIKKILEDCSHKEFSAIIMHLGVFLDTVATYSDFMRDYLAEVVELKDGRDKKFNKFIRDLNKKVNNEYNFSDDVFLIEEGVLFNNQLYLFTNKSHFIKVMNLTL